MIARRLARTTTRSAKGTHALGRRLGALLRPADVVALEGELGAGKTQLVRGACDGAEVPAREVSSPSFAIVATYHGRIPVHHADLYRIADEDELYGTGFGDLVGGEGALLVEWADRIPAALPPERLTIRLSHDERAPSVRHVELEGLGERHAALAEALAGRGSRSRSGSRSPFDSAAPAAPLRSGRTGTGPRSKPKPKSKSRSKKSRSRSRPASRSASRSASGSKRGKPAAPKRRTKH